MAFEPWSAEKKAEIDENWMSVSKKDEEECAKFLANVRKRTAEGVVEKLGSDGVRAENEAQLALWELAAM